MNTRPTIVRYPGSRSSIDGSNLYHSLDENCKRFDLDFAAFAAKLCKGRPLFRTYYYNVLRDPERNQQAYQDQQKFLGALYNVPYLEVRLGGAKMRATWRSKRGSTLWWPPICSSLAGTTATTWLY